MLYFLLQYFILLDTGGGGKPYRPFSSETAIQISTPPNSFGRVVRCASRLAQS